jgi:hypothetical protein
VYALFSPFLKLFNFAAATAACLLPHIAQYLPTAVELVTTQCGEAFALLLGVAGASAVAKTALGYALTAQEALSSYSTVIRIFLRLYALFFMVVPAVFPQSPTVKVSKTQARKQAAAVKSKKMQ